MCGKLCGKHLCTYTIEFGNQLELFESSRGQLILKEVKFHAVENLFEIMGKCF